MTFLNLLKAAPLTALLLLTIAYFLSPLFYYQLGPGGFNDQRFMQLIFGAACLLTVIINRHYRQSFLDFLSQFRPLPIACLAVFFVAGIISSINAPNTLRALQEMGLYAVILIAVIALTHELKQLSQEQLHRLLLISFSAFLVIYALYFVIYYASVYVAEPSRFIDENRWMPNFYNQRSFNQVEVWLLPAFFWLCHQWGRRSLTLKFASYGLIALWWVMLCYSLGRGISLAMLLSTLGIALLFRKRSLFLIKPALITFILGLILYGLMFLAPPYWLYGELPITYLDRIQNTNALPRLQLWGFAWQTFLQYPLFGGGPQHFSFYHGIYGHAHNMVLNYLAELGALGTLPLALLVIIGAWGVIKNALERGSEIDLLIVYCLFAVSVYSQFTAQLYFPAAQLLLILFLALALAENLDTTTPQASDPHRLRMPVVTRPILASICGLALICFFVSAVDVVKKPHVLYQITHINFPRFWLNGNFRRYPEREPLSQVLVCKVNVYAPAFACR